MELKTGYKQTEVGVIPSDWEVKELREVAQFASGTTPRREFHERYFINGNIFWVKTMDLNNAEIFDTSEKITEVAMRETSSLKIFPVNTVLIAMYGGFNQIGRTGILKVNACVNQAITAIKSDNNCLSPQFLIGFLNYRVDYWKDVATSSRKDPNITSKDVKNFKVTIPSLAEQTAIATALSDTDQYITHLEKLIAKKRDIKQGAMQELLKPKEGWVVRKLGEVITVSSGISNTQSTGEKYPIFGSTGLIGWKDYFDYEGIKILVARVGANAGAVNKVNGRYCVSDNTLVLSIKPTNDVDFIFFNLILFQLNSLVFGSGQPLITGSQIKKLDIQFPRVEEQTRIAAILSDMDTEITTLETKLSKAQSIKQGMMQQLLTGKIRLI